MCASSRLHPSRAATYSRSWLTCCSIVCACCCRSVETRAYIATRITGSFLPGHRRQRPAQEELVGAIPPLLPVRVPAARSPDPPGALHDRPLPADQVAAEGVAPGALPQ